jgi:hypothetical protein
MNKDCKQRREQTQPLGVHADAAQTNVRANVLDLADQFEALALSSVA